MRVAQVGLFSVFAAILGLGASMPSRAATITYEATPLGGTLWQYDYVVTNDDLASIAWFAIFFGVNPAPPFDPSDPNPPPPPPPNIALTSITAPLGWTPLAIDPDPFLPDFGYADYQILQGAGITLGQTLGGFSVQFDLPSGTPGSQTFQIYDLFAFLQGGGPVPILQTGTTIPARPVAVPEPAMWLLLALSLLALAAPSPRSVLGFVARLPPLGRRRGCSLAYSLHSST